MKATRILSQTGLKLVDILVIVVIIGLLAVIASPSFMSAPSIVPPKTRINSPGNIDALAAQFILESNEKAEYLINGPSELTPDIRLSLAGSISNFTAGGIYNESVVSAPPACSLGDLATSSSLPP